MQQQQGFVPVLHVASWNVNGMDDIKGEMLVAALVDQAAEFVDMLVLRLVACTTCRCNTLGFV